MNTKLTQNRPAYVTINRQAFKHNLQQVKLYTPAAKVMAVIKADAYGHGMEVAADALAEADYFAVNNLDDLCRLRKHGVTKEVTILSTSYSADELSDLTSLNAQPVIYNFQQLDLLDQLATSDLKSRLPVWLKIDTGMGRLGFLPEQAEAVLQRLEQCSVVAQIGLITHLANADDMPHPLNKQQLTKFQTLVDKLECSRVSILNSAGIMGFSDAAYDVVRPGIMLYGITPLVDKMGEQLGLQPVMTFKSELLSVKELAVGQSIGYGSTYVCSTQTRVGIVACGYGDGYPRHAKNGTPVLVNGKQVELVGRVSMDMIAVDLSNIDAEVGDEVTLWGEGLPVEIVAQAAETLGYELVCGITNRVQRVVRG